VIWDSNIVASYKGEKASVIAMKPYIGEVFVPIERDSIIQRFDGRTMWFRDLITQKRFQFALESLKPRK
jgi:hypothetical protein